MNKYEIIDIYGDSNSETPSGIITKIAIDSEKYKIPKTICVDENNKILGYSNGQKYNILAVDKETVISESGTYHWYIYHCFCSLID